MCGGNPSIKFNLGVVFNGNVIRPQPAPLEARVRAKEALRRGSDLPRDAVRNFSFAPWWVAARLPIRFVLSLLGLLRPLAGSAMAEVVRKDPKSVVDVAGAAAYIAAGFPAPPDAY